MSLPMTKVEVLWSPNKEDEFATYGSELKLYSFQDHVAPEGNRATPPNSGSATDLFLSEQCYGHLIANLNSDVHCMPHPQGVAWQRNDQQPYYFAVGQGSGKVLLANLGLDQSSFISSMNQVLTPRYGRPCTCLSWNPTDPKLLAEGLEKSRSESSLIVWDVTRTSADTPTPTSTSRIMRSFAGGGSDFSSTSDAARCFEAGLGELTTSLAWLPKQTSCLVAGIGKTYLRIYDIRERDRPNSSGHPRDVAPHRANCGICVDPMAPQTIASYEASNVFIWDTRYFVKPMYNFSRTGNIQRLAWMPARAGCLSIVLSAPPYLRLIDIPSYTFSQDQTDVSELYTEHFTQRVPDRCPYYKKGGDTRYAQLTGISWHTKWENTCLLATAEGVVQKLDVYDKVSLSWSPQQQLVHCCSDSLRISSEGPSRPGRDDEDISIKMRGRVKEGYGFDAEKNSKLVRNDARLLEMWKWLQLHQELTSKGVLTQDKGNKIVQGVCSVLGVDKPHLDGSLPPRTSKRLSWNERSSSPLTELPHFPVYTSTERKTALQLCGWSFVVDPSYLEDYLKREELADRYERAAAIAVFQGNIRRGITSLKDGAAVSRQKGDVTKSTQLNLIALALSGYTPQEKKLWHETCAGIKAQISQPYLKAAFVFLCSSGRDGFADVLDCNMSLQDSVGLACTYLDDAQLNICISNLVEEVVEKGLIHGLFLTGLTNSGINLLTNFVNQTGDVQTASLVAGQVMSFAVKHKEVQAWFQGYRDLLDVWQLWHERALFDGQRKKLDATFKPPRQAFIMCSFCSKSIASDSLRHDRRSAYHSSAEQRTPTSCPNCRKPLPRCSLCLLNMVASASKQGQAQDSVGSKVSTDQFGQWFTWCQSCRHGGHAHHISEWFSHHNECPVTGCNCNCFSLDSII